MNHVERFRAVMNFKPFDRLPWFEWAMWWDKTIARWKTQGLPKELKGVPQIAEYLGLDPYCQFWVSTTTASTEAEQHHVGGMVADEDDYIKLKPNIFPEHNFDAMIPWEKKQQKGDAVVWITLEGFFWFPRTLLGIERHMYSFYDQPELLHMLNQDLTDYHIRTLKSISKVCKPTFMTFAEDMSYNHGPMLSKDAFYEFLAPYYNQLIPVLEEMDIVPIIDTDGDVTLMVPWLLDVGIKGVLPLERQAGVDAGKLRADFPDLTMIGHYDKMVMNKGEQPIRDEFERLLPAMKKGGFIPSVDHQTPPGVSLQQYHIFLRLLKEYCQKAAK